VCHWSGGYRRLVCCRLDRHDRRLAGIDLHVGEGGHERVADGLKRLGDPKLRTP
jgi:hypothetical protein